MRLLSRPQQTAEAPASEFPSWPSSTTWRPPSTFAPPAIELLMPMTLLHLVGGACSSRVAVGHWGQLAVVAVAQGSAGEVHCVPCFSLCLGHDSSSVVAVGSGLLHKDLPKADGLVPSSTSFLMLTSIAASWTGDTQCSLARQSHIGRRTMHSLREAFCNVHTSIQNCPVFDSPLQYVCGVVRQDLGCDGPIVCLLAHATGRQSGCTVQNDVDAT